MKSRNNKNNILPKLLIILISNCYLSTKAQNNFEISKTWEVQNHEVVDITIKNDQLLLLTSNNEIMQLDTVDNYIKYLFILKKSSKLTGLTSINNDFYFIDDKGNITKNDNNGTFKQFRIPKNYHTEFLAANDSLFFTCLLNNNGLSYSNRIVSINKSGNDTIFAYIQGSPVGICIKEGYLWYLARQGIIIMYDIKSKEWTQIGELPISNVFGLALIEDLLFTYDLNTKQIIKIKIK